MGLGPALHHTTALLASGPTNLQQTNALVWVMLGISVAGAIVTFGVLVYALWKWRDREASRRPYG
jgi:heme/copper-type cytochrome/quinol oxidase subunit 2